MPQSLEIPSRLMPLILDMITLEIEASPLKTLMGGYTQLAMVHTLHLGDISHPYFLPLSRTVTRGHSFSSADSATNSGAGNGFKLMKFDPLKLAPGLIFTNIVHWHKICTQGRACQFYETS